MTLKSALAYDRSVRTYCVDGRLHVEASNISKATVNPYRGAEIPDFEELGLDPNRVYYLLRDPDELAKAAPTFNNLPILSRHVPVTADDHQPELVVGSTGTDATFNDPYLQNSAVIWAADAIAGIESDEQKEWSCAYRYVADMTPGAYKGLRFDGVMRNMTGNHVALVTEGRAGRDVVVGDSQIEGPKMRLKTRTALMLHGAVRALVAPKLAADAKLDLTPLFEGVAAQDYAKNTKGLGPKIIAALAGKLAQDEDVPVEAVVEIIQAVQGIAAEPEADVIAEPDADDLTGDDSADVSKILAFLKGKLSDEDFAAVTKLAGGEEEEAPALDAEPDDPKDNKPMSKPAMDKALAAVRAETMAEMSAIHAAAAVVEPHIGKLAALPTTAAAVYKMALDAAEVDLTGVHPSAYRALVKLLPTPAGDDEARPLAMDAAGHSVAAASFAKRFPNAKQPLRS